MTDSIHYPPFPIVGIEVTPQSVDALKKLVKLLPAKSGMAFVIIPGEGMEKAKLKDALTDLGKLPVSETGSSCSLAPNRVFLLPHSKSASVQGASLTTEPKPQNRLIHRPVDRFFRSLAKNCRNRCIGVLLTPEAEDGLRGLQAVKACGGVTLAPESSGDPANGSSPGADFYAKPDAMARELARLGKHPYLAAPAADSPLLRSEEEIQQVTATLNQASGVDFSHYDGSKLRGRVLRRMAVHGIAKTKDYLVTLKNKLAEVDALNEEMLGRLSEFFDNAALFSVLSERVFPDILRDRPAGEPVRVWVPNCGTAEEAYSVAICLAEAAGADPSKELMQVFATDISLPAIRSARGGVFGPHAAADIPEKTLKRYFSEVEGGYQVRESLRECLIFTKHDFVNDTPFSKLDLVCAEHAMAYNEIALRKKVIPNLHFALKPSGYLLTGPGAPEIFNEFFNPVAPESGLFAKKALASAGEMGSALDRIIELDEANLKAAPSPDFARLDVLSSNLELQSINEELENTKRELKKSMDFSEAVINTVRDPLVIFDAAFKVVRANRSFFQGFQLLPTQTVNANLFELAGGAWNIPSLKALLQSLIANNVHFQDFEVTREFPAIGRRAMLLNASVIDATPVSGAAPLVLLSMKDITNRKQAEEQVKETNAELVRLGEIKASFSNMVYHEFRTPLAAISESIALVLEGIEGPLEPAQEQMLQVTKRNVERLSLLVNNVLNWTRVELGKMKMIFERADMAALAREALQLMQPMLHKKQIRLSLDLPRAGAEVNCDPDKMKQVIINLLDNAVKYTPQGGEAALRLALKDGRVLLEVEDNGPGIDPADQKKIFQLFGKVPERGKLQNRGFGVGLAICKYIVEQHRGEITVHSKPGEGSRFTVSFPDNLTQPEAKPLLNALVDRGQ